MEEGCSTVKANRHRRNTCGHCNESLSYSAYRSHRDMFYNEATGEWATEMVTTHINSFVDGDNMDTGLMDLEESSQPDSPVHT